MIVLTACDGRRGWRRRGRRVPIWSCSTPACAANWTGFAVCRTLKEEPRTRRIPVILMMAQTTTAERVQGFEAGADDFVAKPFNRIELLARVRSLLRIKALNDQLDEVEDVIYSLSRAMEAREGEADQDGGTERVKVYRPGPGARAGLVRRGAAPAGPGGHAARRRQDRPAGHPAAKSAARSTTRSGSGCSGTRFSGKQIMAPLRSTAALLPIIRHHHERVDGKGYPDGLAGDQIPLGARIVAIADAYNAMLSHRPYRPALTPGKGAANAASRRRQAVGCPLVAPVRRLGRRQPRPIPATQVPSNLPILPFLPLRSD